MHASRRTFLALLPVAALAARAAPARAASANKLDREGENALQQLYATEPHAKTLASRAKGVLVFPDIVKVGVLVLGGETGNGVLLVNNHASGYYNLSAGSVGPQLGGQTLSYALFFMKESALDYLRKSDGWAIGTGPNVVVVDKGAAATLNSTTLREDVYAIPFAQKGLMAGIDLSGSKITSIHPKG